jgi:hypothetical protein
MKKGDIVRPKHTGRPIRKMVNGTVVRYETDKDMLAQVLTDPVKASPLDTDDWEMVHLLLLDTFDEIRRSRGVGK